MKKKIYVFAALAGLGILALTGCKSREKIDLAGIHTTAAESPAATGETMESSGGEKEAPSEETASVKIPKKDSGDAEKAGSKDGTEAGKNTAAALSVRSKIATYKEGKVSVEYPILSNLPDGKSEETVNSLLHDRAVAILKAYEVKPETDTVEIKCNIISLSRNKVVLTYEGSVMNEGAAHPVAVFYTNTVDLNKGAELGLNDYSDAYTMAGYIVSDDCTLEKPADSAKVMEYIKSQTLEQYWEILKQCDFTSMSSESKTGFPQAFSYENQGIIYMAVPTNHELGDYAIIRFAPDTK